MFRATGGREDATPVSILSQLNGEMCRDNDTCMFATVFCCVLDARTGRVEYGNAGHLLPYVMSNGTVMALPRTGGRALGVTAAGRVGTGQLLLKPGDRLVLYTDGVTDAVDDSGRFFSEASLRETLRARAVLAARMSSSESLNRSTGFPAARRKRTTSRCSCSAMSGPGTGSRRDFDGPFRRPVRRWTAAAPAASATRTVRSPAAPGTHMRPRRRGSNRTRCPITPTPRPRRVRTRATTDTGGPLRPRRAGRGCSRRPTAPVANHRRASPRRAARTTVTRSAPVSSRAPGQYRAIRRAVQIP